MGRGIDERSDLYSLGAVLYFVLTGHPPFPGDDALGLVHAHLAKPVPPAHEVCFDVDPALSRVIGKLLQKDPEDRYQTAHALRHDLLECRAQLRRAGSIQSDFELGLADAPHRPLFPKRLCGRDTERQRLQDAYDRAIGGSTQLVLLGGPPGMGKSSLVQELRVPIVASGGYLALGKFDAYRRDTPYAGFVRAFASLAQQMLTESDARLAAWRRELSAALGGGAGALVSLIPDLELVLGHVDAPPVVSAEHSRSRLASAVVRFMEAAATRAHPVVLSLDDLQWADAGSRELLREILLHGKCEALLVIGTYREGELAAEHPIHSLLDDLRGHGVSIDSIQLRPLSPDASAHMLAAALGRSVSETMELASVVARKSGNLPLLIQQIVYRAYDLGLIHFEPGTGWVWDDAEIAAMEIPDDAVSLMTGKLGGLAPEALAVVELASCAGECFDLDSLSGLTRQSREAVGEGLRVLCDEGLIAPTCDGFRFVHDRVRECVRSQLSSERRERLHHEAASRLLEDASVDLAGARLFEVADHLVLAGTQVIGEERRRALRLLVSAGRQALQTGAMAAGGHYLSAARSYFDDAFWETDAALCFELFLQSAEAARQEQSYDAALELLADLEPRAESRIAQAQVAAKRIAVYTTSLPDESCLDEILRTLRGFGVRWSRNSSRFRVRFDGWLTERALRGPLDPDHGFPDRKRADKTEWIAQLMVLAAAAGAVTLYSGELANRMVGFMLRGYRRHGAGPGTQVLLASWAGHRVSAQFDLLGAERYARAALSWSARQADPIRDARMGYVLYNVVYPATGCRRRSLTPLRSAAERLIEFGDHEFGVYSFWAWLVQMLLAGEELQQVRAEDDSLARRTRGASTSRTTGLLSSLVRMLDGSGPRWDDERGCDAELDRLLARLRGYAASRFGPWAAWAMLLAVLGRFEQLLETTTQSTSGAVVIQVGIFRVDLMFFRALALGACASAAAPRPRRAMKRELLGYRRSLEQWSRINPRFSHVARSVAAEYERLRGRDTRALSLYGRAASEARERGYIQHAALLYERSAGLLAEMGRQAEAIADRRQAMALYRTWGAHAKATALAPLLPL